MSYELLPVTGLFDLVIEPGQCSVVHVLLDFVEQCCQFVLKMIPFQLHFVSIVSYNTLDLLVFHIFWSELQSDWHSLYLPTVELPAWIVIVPVIKMHSQSTLLELGAKSPSFFDNIFFLAFERDWDYYDLDIGHSWRQY